jgi:hypothetical protein
VILTQRSTAGTFRSVERPGNADRAETLRGIRDARRLAMAPACGGVDPAARTLPERQVCPLPARWASSALAARQQLYAHRQRGGRAMAPRSARPPPAFRALRVWRIAITALARSIGRRSRRGAEARRPIPKRRPPRLIDAAVARSRSRLTRGRARTFARELRGGSAVGH